VYEVDGFRFRRKKKRTTEISTVETTQDETASSQKVATWNNHETALETETAPDESQENACALEQKERTKQLQCERISKDQSEEQRLKALCEAIWTDIYKETIEYVARYLICILYLFLIVKVYQKRARYFAC